MLIALMLLVASDWQLVGEKNGVRVEARLPQGRKFEQVRVTTTVTQTPELLCAKLWTIKVKQKTMQLEQVLKETANQRVMYCQVKTPVVSDRDYTIQFDRSYDPATKVCEIAFHTVNDQGPPPKDAFVRLPVVEGSWIGEPDGATTLLSYIVYSEPGGWIAPWIAKNALRDATLDWVIATAALLKDK